MVEHRSNRFLKEDVLKIHPLLSKESNMAARHGVLLTLFIISFLSLPAALASDKPDLMLAKIYQQGIDISLYWVSEKLDGVRARWDGQHLLSRGGHVFVAPRWFTENFPAISLDGELWIGQSRYEETASIVRRQHPHDDWRVVRFMVFDVPEHGGTFDERASTMKDLAKHVDSPYFGIIKQESFDTEETLKKRLQAVLTQGGEGLMLHRKTAYYANGRSQDLLKLKPSTDAEATVIGYRPGKGKFTGQVGSLKVQTDEGLVFFVGSGLSDAQRHTPPPLQSRITFRHQGFTKNGIPRFPVFVRIRNEQPE